MSQLEQFRMQLYAIADDADSTSGNVASFTSQFSTSIAQVQDVIGGSASRTDQEIISTLAAAQSQLNEVICAFENTVQTPHFLTRMGRFAFKIRIIYFY